MRELDKFFYPESVAVIGASNDEGKAGYQILKNLIELDFDGKVYPVNPKEDEIFGRRCYPSLKDIDAKVDLILVSVPAPIVPGVFMEAKERGDVKAAVILASGFSETRIPERISLEEEVVRIAKEASIRVSCRYKKGAWIYEFNFPKWFFRCIYSGFFCKPSCSNRVC